MVGKLKKRNEKQAEKAFSLIGWAKYDKTRRVSMAVSAKPA
jgi:hypothetical protein